MPDADLDQAVQGGLAGMRFTRQGQSCTASSRMIVHESIHDEYVRRLKAGADKLVLGDPLDEATDVGTIISRAQHDKIRSYIALAEQDAACTLIRCAMLPPGKELDSDLYLQPTIVTGVSNDSVIAREEIFGPVTCVIRFKDYEEAISMANDSEFGLAATIWTKDLKTAMDAACRLEAGLFRSTRTRWRDPTFPMAASNSPVLARNCPLSRCSSISRTRRPSSSISSKATLRSVDSGKTPALPALESRPLKSASRRPAP
jgi:acyl-CoA reductase-like NAD-dependent aldehyde dehydrogenase